MTAAKPFKGVPFKPMRRQLRGVKARVKFIKIEEAGTGGRKYIKTTSTNKNKLDDYRFAK